MAPIRFFLRHSFAFFLSLVCINSQASGEGSPSDELLIYDFTNYHLQQDGSAPYAFANGSLEVSEFSFGALGTDDQELQTLATAAIDVFGARSFESGVANPEDYYFLEFTITPQNFNLMTLCKLSFVASRSGSGPKNISVRSNIEDNYATNVGVEITVTENLQSIEIELSELIYTMINTPVTFRIYGYNSEDWRGTLRIDDVIVEGSVIDVEDLLVPNGALINVTENMYVANLVIEPTGQLNVIDENAIYLYADAQIDGLLNPGYGSVYFNGYSQQAITGSGISFHIYLIVYH